MHTQLQETIREAMAADVPKLAALADAKRREYATYSPIFWRPAPDAKEKHAPFLEQLVCEDKSFVFVSEQEGFIAGFITGRLLPAPPVYAPGGPVCLIDDFVVADPERWLDLGAALFGRLEEAALAAGATLTVTVCGAADRKKLAMIEELGATPTSHWCVKALSSR